MRHPIALFAALLLLAAWPADLMAQGRVPGGVVVTDSLIASYTSRLKLSAEQETALRSLLETQSEKAREMAGTARTQGPDSMSALRPKMLELQEDTSRQVEELLTDDQIPEYRRIQAEIQEMRRSRMQQRTPQ